MCDKSAYPALSVASRDDALYPYHVTLTKRLFPDSKSIQIVRDPRDVLASSKHYFGFKHLGKDEIISYAHSWSKCNLRWLSDKPNIVIRFEDLKNNFEETIRLIFDSIGLDYDHTTYKKVIMLYKSIDLSQKSDPTFYRQGIIGDWKKTLTDEESDIISTHGAAAMSVFDYA